MPTLRPGDDGSDGAALQAVTDEETSVLGELENLLSVVREMNRGSGLAETMQAVADGIIRGTGFANVVINFLRADGMFEVMTVSGDPDMEATLRGVVFPAEELMAEMEIGERWGRLRFLPEGTVNDDVPYTWLPDLPEPDGPNGWRAGDALFAPMYDVDHELIGIISVDTPISGQRPDAFQRQLLELLSAQAEVAIGNARLAQRLQASEQSFRMAFVRSAVGMAIVGLDESDPLRMISTNPALDRLAGHRLPPDSLLTDLLESNECNAQQWAEAIRNAAGGVHHLERRVQTSLGARWLQFTASALPRQSMDSPQAIVQVEDVTQRRRLEQTHGRDPLTGLANRAALQGRMTRAVLSSRELGTTGAVFFCDLDGFKTINDTLGHAEGDALLVTCAARLQSLIRANDFLCRFGGDEFVIVMDSIGELELELLVDRIRASITAPVTHGGRSYQVGISLGWAKIDGMIDDVDRLLAAPDAAMYADKRASR